MANDDPRIYWAKERTFLAWVRTGLALMGFGFVVARFGLFLRMFQVRDAGALLPHSAASMWLGTLLVVLGVMVQVGATADYLLFCGRLKRGESVEPRMSKLGVGVAFSLTLIGLLMSVYLVSRG